MTANSKNVFLELPDMLFEFMTFISNPENYYIFNHKEKAERNIVRPAKN